MANNEPEYDAEWEGALFTGPIPVVKGWATPDEDDWEARYNEDTTGYVSDPLTTSFTDMDLGPALLKLGRTAEWADLDWLES
jgi:hypothetical protein